jgi:DedD protein
LNDGLKQRIIGALVLVVLGVIFLPMILDFKGDRYIDKSSRIPHSPDIMPTVMTAPQKPIGIPEPKNPEEIYQLADPTTSVADDVTIDVTPHATKTSLLNDKGLPITWVVKVVSYVDKIRANELSTELQKSGLKSFVRSAKISGKTYYRVFVGPFVEKARALNTQKTIDKKYKVQSILQKFKP